MSNKRYDVLIIGAGPSGLSAGLRLAHFGLSVCLIDAHTRIGGLNSWYTRNFQEISVGLHAVTNYLGLSRTGALAKLFRQLRLKISNLSLVPQRYSLIEFPSATLSFDNTPESLNLSVQKCFPDSYASFLAFREYINSCDEGEITDVRQSARKVLSSFFQDKLLIDMLLCPVMFYGSPGGVGDGLDFSRLEPDMDWLLFCVLWKCIFETGLAYPTKGIRPLWEEMARLIISSGGELLLGKRVSSFLTSENRIVGVKLASGEEFTSSYVLSSAGYLETMSLCGITPTPASQQKSPTTIVEAYASLKSSASSIGFPETIKFFSLSDRLDFSCSNSLFNPNCGLICAPSNYAFSPELSPPPSLKISCLANYDYWHNLSLDSYSQAKQLVSLDLKDLLFRLGLDINEKNFSIPRKSFSIFTDLFTPLTLERYTHHFKGSIYGNSVKSRSGATPFDNLFLIGSDQGFHGIVGGMLSGVSIVNLRIFSKLK